MYSVDFFNFLHVDILSDMLKRDESENVGNCICSRDNWVNKTNLEQKQNSWHFNENNITFCALNDAL